MKRLVALAGGLAMIVAGVATGARWRMTGEEPAPAQDATPPSLSFPLVHVRDSAPERSPRLSIVGHIGGTCAGVVVEADRLYSDCDSRFVMYDVSTPASPVARGSVDVPGGVMAFTVSGSRAYLVDPASKLHVIDVTEPTALREETVTALQTGIVRRVAVGGRFLFLGEDQAGRFGVPTGLRVVDVHDGHTPVQVDLDILSDVEARDVSIQDGVAYVGAWSVEGVGGVYLYAVSSDGTIDIMSSVVPPLGGGVTGVAASGTRGYINVSSVRLGVSEMQVVDLDEPDEPYTLGMYQFPRGATAIPEPGYRPREESPWLYRLSVTGTQVMSLESHYGTSAGEGEPRQRYVLRLINVSNDSSPISEASVELNLNRPAELAFDGDHAYVAGGDSGIYVVKVVR